MVCSAWNPQHLSRQALPPCHLLWNVVVIGGTINLGWYQRSCDLMLGVPFNIASYGLLLELLAAQSGLKLGKLSGTLADCHIYENQIDAARVQLEREPRRLPKLHVAFKESIYEWTHEQFSIENYNPYPKIDFGGVAV
jgi:thymidylate synthase